MWWIAISAPLSSNESLHFRNTLLMEEKCVLQAITSTETRLMESSNGHCRYIAAHMQEDYCKMADRAFYLCRSTPNLIMSTSWSSLLSSTAGHVSRLRSPHLPFLQPCTAPSLPLPCFLVQAHTPWRGHESFTAAHNALGRLPRERRRQTEWKTAGRAHRQESERERRGEQ